MPYVNLPSHRAFYEESGSGSPLVFLHGFSVDSRSWEEQLAYFSRTFRVLIPDARGHGKSDAPPSGYSRADRVEDLLALANALSLDRFHLVGLSMGGSTAVGFALNHPQRLESMTLAASGAAGYKVSGKFDRLGHVAREKGVDAARAQWMDWALAWYRLTGRKDLQVRMQGMIEDYSGAVWKDPVRGHYPKEVDLPKVGGIEIPTLIMAGEKDRIFLPLAEQLHKLIPDNRLIVYKGIGHMINLEAPQQFNEDLERFLAEVEGRAA